MTTGCRTLQTGSVHMRLTLMALWCAFDAAAAGANYAYELWFHSTAAIIVDVPSWARRPPQAASSGDSSSGRLKGRSRRKSRRT
jgi:hypothetical protein